MTYEQIFLIDLRLTGDFKTVIIIFFIVIVAHTKSSSLSLRCQVLFLLLHNHLHLIALSGSIIGRGRRKLLEQDK